MITIEVIPHPKNDNFNFEISEDGEFACLTKYKRLSEFNVRQVWGEGRMSHEILDAVGRKLYSMGFVRSVFDAPPERQVSRLAVLQRKTPLKWSYLVPLEELYGSRN
jgi:hypothetical protein